MKKAAALFAVLALGASAPFTTTAAAPPPGDRPVFVNGGVVSCGKVAKPQDPKKPQCVFWQREPGKSDIAAAYPAEAKGRGIAGLVALNCRLFSGGSLECHVKSETPAAWGFGKAALKLVERVRSSAPGRWVGEPLEVWVRFVPDAP